MRHELGHGLGEWAGYRIKRFPRDWASGYPAWTRSLVTQRAASAKLASHPTMNARAKAPDRSDPQGDAPAWGVSSFFPKKFGTSHVRAARQCGRRTLPRLAAWQ